MRNLRNPVAELYGHHPAIQSLADLREKDLIPDYEKDDRSNKSGMVKLDPKWVQDNMVFQYFPIIGQRYVNKYMAAALWDVLTEIDSHPDPAIQDYIKPRQCGIFVPRTIGWKDGNRLSLHSIGIAIDINWSENPYGKSNGTIRSKVGREIISIFERHGFFWGGNWNTPDDMHFQYAARAVKIPKPRKG